MDRLAACHVMHGFLNIHKEARKRNTSLPGNHTKKYGHRSHSLSEKKGVISTLKDEYKKNCQTHHRNHRVSESHEENESESFNSIFHRVLDYGTSHNAFYHHQMETLLDPVKKLSISHSPKYKLSNHNSDIFSPSKYFQTNIKNSQNNIKCGYLLLSINYLSHQNELIIHIGKAANLPISQPHKKSVSYVKVVLIQDHQFVNCAKSGTFVSTPFIHFDKTFTFKLIRNQPTLSLLILVIQKSSNFEKRELGHLIFGDEGPDNQLEEIKIEDGKKRYSSNTTTNNHFSGYEVSKQNEMIPLSIFISRQKFYNQSDCLQNEYHSSLDKEICDWFKLSNKW